MKIKEIISQYRRDFTAIYECEHCGHTEEGHGYDDRNFHENVIPGRRCGHCNRDAADCYRALAPKYPEDAQL